MSTKLNCQRFPRDSFLPLCFWMALPGMKPCGIPAWSLCSTGGAPVVLAERLLLRMALDSELESPEKRCAACSWRPQKSAASCCVGRERGVVFGADPLKNAPGSLCPGCDLSAFCIFLSQQENGGPGLANKPAHAASSYGLELCLTHAPCQ